MPKTGKRYKKKKDARAPYGCSGASAKWASMLVSAFVFPNSFYGLKKKRIIQWCSWCPQKNLLNLIDTDISNPPAKWQVSKLWSSFWSFLKSVTSRCGLQKVDLKSSSSVKFERLFIDFTMTFRWLNVDLTVILLFTEGYPWRTLKKITAVVRIRSEIYISQIPTVESSREF